MEGLAAAWLALQMCRQGIKGMPARRALQVNRALMDDYILAVPCTVMQRRMPVLAGMARRSIMVSTQTAQQASSIAACHSMSTTVLA